MPGDHTSKPRRSRKAIPVDQSFAWVVKTFWSVLCPSPTYDTRPTPVDPMAEGCTRNWSAYIAAKYPRSKGLRVVGGQCETGLAQHALKVKAGDSTKEIRALEVREFSFGADEIKEERAFQVDGRASA